MIGFGRYHRGLIDWYISLILKELASILLPCVDGQKEICLDLLLNLGKIIVDECLINGNLHCMDMVEELPDRDTIYSITRIVNFSIVYIVDTC